VKRKTRGGREREIKKKKKAGPPWGRKGRTDGNKTRQKGYPTKKKDGNRAKSDWGEQNPTQEKKRKRVEEEGNPPRLAGVGEG